MEQLYWETWYRIRSACWIAWFVISGVRIPAYWQGDMNRREYFVHLWDMGRRSYRRRLLMEQVHKAFDETDP